MQRDDPLLATKLHLFAYEISCVFDVRIFGVAPTICRREFAAKLYQMIAAPAAA